MNSHIALGLATLGFTATACTSMSSTGPIETSTRFAFTSFDGPGGGATTVNGMNDDGDVVGFTTATSGSATVNTNFVRHPDGTFATLSISDPAASANGINNAGTIVGVANSAAFVLPTAGQLAALSPFGAASSVAFGINAGGVVVGQFAKSSTLSPGFVDAGGAFAEIDPTAASIMTFAQTINADGTVAGFYSEDGTTQHGFTYDSASKAVALVADPSTPRIQASPLVLTQLLSINSRSQIAGYYQTTDGSQYGLVYDAADGTYVFLDEPQAAPVSGVQITQITGIDDANELAGFYIDATGAQHGFVATPM